MSEPMRRDIDALLNDREGMDAALPRTVILTLQTHKRAGNPIAVWQTHRVEAGGYPRTLTNLVTPSAGL